MLKVWGRLNSLNVQKAMFCILETGIPFERMDAGMEHGVVRTPEYIAMNPNSVVPTISDDGFVLWESNVIVRYIAAKHSAGVLWPLDPRERADSDRWMDWQQTSFNPPLTTIFWDRVRSPGKTPADQLAQGKARLDNVIGILDAAFARREWMGGNAFNMADCVIAPGVHRYLNLPGERAAAPNVERYYKQLMQRPVAKRLLTLPLT
jgi:glutathione S-transferase